VDEGVVASVRTEAGKRFEKHEIRVINIYATKRLALGTLLQLGWLEKFHDLSGALGPGGVDSRGQTTGRGVREPQRGV
jgi:hypothetical protein